MPENFIALTIAGSDPGGGAGIQADLKTFQRFRVYGTSVVTLVTVQNTVRMSRVETLDPGLVGEQFDAVLEDLTPHAIKTGALGTAAIIEAIAARKFVCPLVVDPVTMGKHGLGKHALALMDVDARSAMRRLLLPRAALVTPNLDEAAEMAGIPVQDAESMREAARRIAGLGARAVLVKGGHLVGDALDILWDGRDFTEFRMARVESRHTHGTGCVYSAAITAGLARGLSLAEAVGKAKDFVHAAILSAPGIGAGAGPLGL